MKHFTWPAVVVFIAVLATLATIFGLDTDPAVRQRVLGYFDSVVPFILGIGAGAVGGGAGGFAAGLLRGQRNVEELKQALESRKAETVSPEPSALRRAAEVVRVAADESHQAADEARAAATALRVATEEGRAVAELQRSLLSETRRAMATQDGSVLPWPGGQAGSRGRAAAAAGGPEGR